MTQLVSISNNENSNACQQCGGYCCKQCAGLMLPNQFDHNDLVNSIVQKINSGKYCIDWWEGDIGPTNILSQIYFIRPSHKNKIGEIKDPSWGGECVFLTENGCQLSFDSRPYQCKALVPKDDNTRCHGIIKEKLIPIWRKYQDEINQALKALNENSISN